MKKPPNYIQQQKNQPKYKPVPIPEQNKTVNISKEKLIEYPKPISKQMPMPMPIPIPKEMQMKINQLNQPKPYEVKEVIPLKIMPEVIEKKKKIILKIWK